MQHYWAYLNARSINSRKSKMLLRGWFLAPLVSYIIISPVLLDLHWLPVKKRVDFKLLVITYKALHGSAPAYISNLIELHVPGRHGLSSACSPKLSERRSRRSWGDRSLMVAAPRLWNNLPHDIQHSSTLNTFKSKLKTHFMQTSFETIIMFFALFFLFV